MNFVLYCAKCLGEWVTDRFVEGEAYLCPYCGRDPGLKSWLYIIPNGVMYVYDERPYECSAAHVERC